jgi:aminoacrylate hydrolase
MSMMVQAEARPLAAGSVLDRGSGRPVLMLSGLGGRADFWAAQMDRLSGRFRCLSFDHRALGDGASGRVADVVAMLAGDALDLLDQLGIACADIIGHSLGGAIAQHLAIHAPERVNRLVLSATWAGPTEPFLALFALRRAVLESMGPRAYLEQGAWLGYPGWWVMENYPRVQEGIAARLAGFGDVGGELGRLAAVMAHDLRDRVAQIRAPTLVVCSQDDSITPLPLSRELAERIAGARLAVLPTGGHFAPSTVPDIYADCVGAHLQ